MNTLGKPLTFWREVAVALGLSLAAWLAFMLMRPLLGSLLGLKLTVVVLANVYLLHLLRGSREKAGRVVSLAAWLLLTGALLVLDPPLLFWLAAQIGGVWLLRCLYLHDSLLVAGADALLNGFALFAAASAALYSNSLLLTVWTFFLVQALHVALPRLRRRPTPSTDTSTDPFEQAWRSADEALRRLSAEN